TQKGPLAIILKERNEFIGTVGIHFREFTDTPDIGYALLPAYYGQGYAYAASKLLINYARENWGITQIGGMVLPHHLASIRILEKLGLKFVKRFYVPNDPEELAWYLSE
ncbi:MAG: GNAT family N-acetyltransferase, partial [Bacteroidota bacterium]|nr:GNAT family N-acetyltransferase [Bacteroidota bacterium]